MSLFSGIKFSSDQAKALAASSASAASSITTTPVSATATGPSPTASTSKASGEWSAALKFAPRLNKPKPTPRPTGFTPTINASSSTSNNTPPASAAQVETRGDVMRTAEPKLNIPVSRDGGHEEVLGPDGKILARAPAMTLAAAGEKEWVSRESSKDGKRERGPKDGRKRKNKKKKLVLPQHIVATFDPDEQYDPNRPNDLGEYQAYRRRLKEEKRDRLIEERRRKAAGEGSSDESSYYTDSEEEIVPRRDAPKMFAPPKAYSPPSTSRHHSSDPIPLPPKFKPSSEPATGDDAYARRLALSQAASGDDAYARRLALSQAASGDEAFARRQALSQGLTSQPELPQYIPPPHYAPPPPPPLSAPMSAPPPPPPSENIPPPPVDPAILSIPGFGSYTKPPSAPLPPLYSPVAAIVPAPPTFTPGASAPPAGANDFQKKLEESKKAAEALAAKYLAQAGLSSGPAGIGSAASGNGTLENSEGGTFAERMMRKMGHKEGSGLGRHGTGILHALTAEHLAQSASEKATSTSTTPGQPLSKRALAKQKAAAANAKNRKWVQAPNARGKIINANEDERQRLEKERLGEASRVICLLGMVDGEAEVDEDLSDEIGEECSKFGIVERVVLHMVEPPPPNPADCLRIFIVFSGMAGAWRAIKELDGRFFGGKKIRALYFEETKFEAGDRDGDL